MSNRAEAGSVQDSGPQRRQKEGDVYVHKPKRGGNKPGRDRRFMARTRNFDDNMHRKMEGEEIPTTLRVSENYEKYFADFHNSDKFHDLLGAHNDGMFDCRNKKNTRCRSGLSC